MIYALITLAITNIVTIAAAAALVVASRREVRAEREAARADAKALTDQLVLLKVDPPMAAVQAMPVPAEPQHISHFDDEALARHEEERERLALETRSLLEQYDRSEAAA